jgi:malate dehydrogenase
MSFVAIVGAGELGGAIARTLATRGRVGDVRLIDAGSSVAAGKALDIQQAGPIERSDTRITAFADVTAAVGAAAVLLADEVAGDEGLALVRQLAGLQRDAVLVCAGGGQQLLIERGLRELHLPRHRLFGSAPEAAVQALRALVAVEAGLSPSDVALTVLGRVPGGLVVPWNDATIAGRPAARVLTAPQLARLERRAAVLGVPGPYALAAAAARAGEMLVGGSRKVICCTAGLDGEFGLHRAVSSLPVVLGPGGIVRVVAPALDPRERVLIENALA